VKRVSRKDAALEDFTQRRKEITQRRKENREKQESLNAFCLACCMPGQNTWPFFLLFFASSFASLRETVFLCVFA
jgi:hypothetical protein